MQGTRRSQDTIRGPFPKESRTLSTEAEGQAGGSFPPTPPPHTQVAPGIWEEFLRREGTRENRGGARGGSGAG